MTLDRTLASMRKATTKLHFDLIRSSSKDVIKALQKHSFVLKDPELWDAANRLNDALKGYEDYVGSGIVREETEDDGQG